VLPSAVRQFGFSFTEQAFMASQQYLFRIYHNPTVLAYHNPSSTPYVIEGYAAQPRLPFYSEHVYSLAVDTVNLALTASTLAFADACLMVGTTITHAVAWEIEEDKGIDQTTPVAIFHMFNDVARWPQFAQYQPNLARDAVQLGDFANSYWDDAPQVPRQTGFASFNLVGVDAPRSALDIIPDEYFAISDARAAKQGRYQSKNHRRCLCSNDLFVSDQRTLVLATTGTLFNTRYPIYKQILESLPWQHTGYTVTPDGAAKKREVVTGKRVLMGASEMAQQRRQLIRQQPAAALLYRAWSQLVETLHTMFMFNQFWGWNHAEVCYEDYIYNFQTTATVTPRAFVLAHLQYVVEFINFVGVASGNTGLLIHDKYMTRAQREVEYSRLLGMLTEQSGYVQQVTVQGKTKNAEILQHMVELVARIMSSSDAFDAEFQEAAELPVDGSEFATRGKGYSIADAYENYARKWPSIVGDFMSVYQLLFSWQLTFDPAQNTRGKAGDTVIRNYLHERYPDNWFKTNRAGARKITRAPELTGRVAEERPTFAPFRLWAYHSYNKDAVQVDRELMESSQRDADNARLARQQAEEAARKEARRIAAQQRIDDLRAEWLRTSVPNPDDIYDYRNWSRSEYWLVELKEPLTLEFVKRTLNVPDELESLQEIFGTNGGKAANEVKEETDSNANREFMRSVAKSKRLPSRNRFVRWVVRRIAEEYVEEVSERTGEAIRNYRKPVDDHDPVYSDRDFWPNDDAQ
jgi:hypothetical protein